MDFTSLSWELWLALGVALLAAEALGASGFLIGAAVAALANAVLVWLMPEMSSTAQVVIYSVSAVIATIVYFQVFRDAQRTSSRPNLNKRTAKLVGTRFTLTEEVDGEARVQLGDTFWKVRASERLPVGSEVEVVGADDMTLELAARKSASAPANSANT